MNNLRYSKLKKYSFGDWMNQTGNQAISQQPALQNSAYNMGNYQGSDFGRNSVDQTEDKIMGAVGKAGPIGGIIGAAYGAISSIAEPIREDALATSTETGGYADINTAINTERAGSFIDPLRAGLESLKDDDAKWYEKWASFLPMGSVFQKKKVKRQNQKLMDDFQREQIARGKKYDYQKQVQNFANADNSQYAGLNNFEIGGSLMGRGYNGKSHTESQYGGIPVDAQGEPTIMSGNEPVGLTEGNEFKYTFNDGNTYIFSDKF